jgi:hypothetical protein
MKTARLLSLAFVAASFAGCAKGKPRVADAGWVDPLDSGPVLDAPETTDAALDARTPKDRYLVDRIPLPEVFPWEASPVPRATPDAALAWRDDFNPTALDWFVGVGGRTSWSVVPLVVNNLLSQGSSDPANWTILHSRKQFSKNQIIEVSLRITERDSETALAQVVVFGRYDANSDKGVGFALRVDGTGVLRKRDRGITSSYLQSTPLDLDLGEWHVVRLELVEGDLSAFVDGVLVSSARDSDPIAAEGAVALGCVGAAAEFDWVTVTSW